MTLRLPGWTAVIINYNGAGHLDACLTALSHTHVAPHDIVVLDNASTDDSLQELHAFPRVNTLAQPRNLGFAGGANAGLATVETEVAVLLNPDVEVESDFGEALLQAFASDATLGAVGPLLLYPDGKTIQHAGGVIERPLMTTRHRGYGSIDSAAFSRSTDVEFVTGGALGLRLEAARTIGGFDEQFSPVYYEDVDFCLRLRHAGWVVRFDPSLRATHHEGVTLQRSAAYFRHLHRNRIRFALKHLSDTAWRESFVPAEYARIRHELQSATSEVWAEHSGADALEATLRGGDNAASWDADSPLADMPVDLLRSSVEAVRDAWEVHGEPLRSRIPLVGRFRNWLNDAGPRWYVDQALARQREFNAAVVRAFEVQDRLNREQTAALLLIAIDAIGRLRQIEQETTDPQSE